MYLVPAMAFPDKRNYMGTVLRGCLRFFSVKRLTPQGFGYDLNRRWAILIFYMDECRLTRLVWICGSKSANGAYRALN